MKNTVKILTITTLALGVSSISNAGETQKVQFKYNPAAPTMETYATIKHQARKACKAELGSLLYLGGKECTLDYVSEVVAKINRKELTAFHKSHNSDAGKIIKLSELEKDISDKK